MDRAKSIAAKLLLHFPPHSRWVVFSSQSQYFAAFLINFSINLAMNFNHRTWQGEPSIVKCIGSTKPRWGWMHHSSGGSLACWSSANILSLTRDCMFRYLLKKHQKEGERILVCSFLLTVLRWFPSSGLQEVSNTNQQLYCGTAWFAINCKGKKYMLNCSHLFQLQTLNSQVT